MNQNANSLGIFTESITNVSCPSCNAELDVSGFDVFEKIECPACQEEFQVPGRLGGFILIEELGRGAMGCVYLAMDESLQRLVALKVLRKEYGTDPKMLETVQREAQAMATLNHRNIVQVYSFGRVEEQPYFVMELLEGERLDEMMEGGGQISEIRALEIALDVAQGLDAANQAGLTHGDIKPANILMNEHGVAKVVDFGLAKFMVPGAEIEVWGTPYYIAPEKARKKGEDSRSDQYSLGGTLFHSLAGQPPFDGENPTKVVVAALKEETPNLLDFNPGVTEKTAAVILRMMDKNPNRRYPTYASLLADLNLAVKEAKANEEAKLEQDRREHERQNKKKNPLVFIVLLISILVCSVIGVLVWKQTQKPTSPPIAKYAGPQREVHQPFTRPEIRNMKEAVSLIKDKNLTEAEQKLATAQNLIPDQHAAMSWFKFLEAGIYFYAQYPDRAKTLLEEAAGIENLIFDSEKTPYEDPRILAKYALGILDDRDLEKTTRKAQPYFAHMSEIAIGYRYLLNNEQNQSARHFKYYSELRVQGIQWPYVIQPLASLLHVPLEKLMYDAEKQEVLDAKGKELLSGLGLRSSEGYPRFKLVFIAGDDQPKLTNETSPSWLEKGDVAYSIIPNRQMLASASGVQVLKGRSFTLVSRILTPAASERVPGESDVLFHLGGFRDKENPETGANTPIKGLVLEVPPILVGNGSLRVRIGDGKNDLLVQSIPHEALKIGNYQVFSLSWDGHRSDGSTPSYQLVIAVDGIKIGSIDLQNGPYPQVSDLTFVTFAKGLGQGSFFGWGGGQSRLGRTYVLDGALKMTDLQAFIADTF